MTAPSLLFDVPLIARPDMGSNIMQSSSRTAGVSRVSAWTGRILSALVAAFLLFDAVAKVIKLAAVVKASAQVGFDEQAVQFIGVVLLVSTLLYIIPVTSVLGAILLTGYFGSARRHPPPESCSGVPDVFRIYVWRACLAGTVYCARPTTRPGPAGRKNRS